jgi:hypothetical protein
MAVFVVASAVAIVPITAAAQTSAKPVDRAFEGDWYVSDSTDNNTGAREVNAFQMYIKPDYPSIITLRMRCSSGKPTFFIEWQDAVFPDHTVVTIGPVLTPDSEPNEQQYVFDKVDGDVERGLRASPETSAKIVAALGTVKYATVTAYLGTGSKTVGIDVAGTQRAWSRVTRHCPVQILPLLPL